MAWERKTQLQCPNCEQTIKIISYSRDFHLIDGERIGGFWSWITDCCNTSFLDDMYLWENVKDEDGSMWSALVSKIDGSSLFVWKEVRGIQEDVEEN